MDEQSRIQADRLIEFATAVYESEGMPSDDARLIADTLVQADLWGHQSHGVLRLGWYLDRLRNKVMRPTAQIEQLIDAGAMGLVDGHDSVGQVVTMQATKQAMRRAKEHGVGVVGVRNSNHFGTCMYYTLTGAREDCVMLLTSNG
ncbi:MAG: Ldh family oxidoreductase, partial [Burkholderiales bacterium]